MYPIPASRALTLFEIADHWSRKIKPKRSKMELFNDLAQAWWRGEFKSSDGRTRLTGLKALYKTRRHTGLIFWIDGKKRPKTDWVQPDKSVAVLLLPVLPVPSGRPDTWADEDCTAAYEAIAQDWGDRAFSIIEPVLGGGSLSELEFSRWTVAMGYKRPKFWAATPVVSVELATPSVEPLPKKRPGEPHKFVKQYLANSKAAGNRPTKLAMEAEARTAGLKGGRDQRRAEFDRQMGGEAPGRGRPRHNSPI